MRSRRCFLLLHQCLQSHSISISKPSLQLLDDIFKLVCVVEVLVRAVLDGIWEDTCHDDNLYADL